MDREIAAKAFNEWMRRYTEEPERFKSDWQAIKQYLGDQASGIEPSYGATCAAYLVELMTDVTAGPRWNPE